MNDIVEQLRELRQSGVSSVVAGTEARAFGERPNIPHPLEDWLYNVVADQYTEPGERELDLLILSGNSGDGKSHLIREVRQRLGEFGLQPNDVAWLFDATHSLDPSEVRADGLDGFFAPFSDVAIGRPQVLRVAAINTGAVLRFCERDRQRTPRQFSKLDAILQMQLGITLDKEIALEPLFQRVLVVDLDRRTLIRHPVDTVDDYFELLLDLVRLNNPDGLLADQAADPTRSCVSCAARPNCPVYANLSALSHGRVRSRLRSVLCDVAFEERAHLGPRLLWQVLHELTVGGLDRSSSQPDEGRWNCRSLREHLPPSASVSAARPSLSAALFFNSLFGWAEDESSGPPEAVRREFRRVDPATQFDLDGFTDALRGGLSQVRETTRELEALASELGTSTPALLGPPDDGVLRSVGAIRRRFFLSTHSSAATRLQEAIAGYHEELLKLKDVVLESQKYNSRSLHGSLADAFKTMQHSAADSNLWDVPLPWKPSAPVYTKFALPRAKSMVERDLRTLGPDAEVQSRRPLTISLARSLDALPRFLPVRLDGGSTGRDVVVKVDWSLFRLLRSVTLFGGRAASLDAETFQRLDRIAAGLLVRHAAHVVKVDGFVMEFEDEDIHVESARD